jgi:hypothetical protein
MVHYPHLATSLLDERQREILMVLRVAARSRLMADAQ